MRKRTLSASTISPSHHMLTHSNLVVVVCSDYVWLDHKIEPLGALILKKRGFYFFSRGVPEQPQHYHSKQRIMLTLNTKSLTDAIRQDKIIRQFSGQKAVEVKIYTKNKS